MMREKRGGKDGVNRQPRAARHERIDQNRQNPVAAIFKNPRAHDGRDVAAEAEQHGQKRLSMQADAVHDAIHDERDPRHVAASFQQGDHEIERKNDRQKDRHAADSGDDAVRNEGNQPRRGLRGKQRGFDGRAAPREQGFYRIQQQFAADV